MYTTYPVEVASLDMQILCVQRHRCLAVMERLIHWQMIKSKNLSMQSTWITLFLNIYIFSCLISLYSFVNGDRIIESVPTHFSKANGFESITEWLNVIRSGHLKIQATCDIPFQTEVLLDYNLIRYCFHPSCSCSSSFLKPPTPLCEYSQRTKFQSVFLFYQNFLMTFPIWSSAILAAGVFTISVWQQKTLLSSKAVALLVPIVCLWERSGH